MKNRTKKFEVTTKNGNKYIWSFTEFKTENDYGNGIYIGIERPSHDHCSLDCRYDPDYKFHKTCVNYLLNWYGENLDELMEVNQ